MAKISPPSPDSVIKVEVTMPIRLWWKLMETAQRRKMKLSYMLFNILTDAAGFDGDNESYDLLLKEIEDNMDSN